MKLNLMEPLFYFSDEYDYKEITTFAFIGTEKLIIQNLYTTEELYSLYQ